MSKTNYNKFHKKIKQNSENRSIRLPYKTKPFLLAITNGNLDVLADKGRFSRITNKLRSTFGKQKINDFVKSKQRSTKVRGCYLIKSPSNKKEYSNLVYRDGVLYRNITRKSYEIWAELYKKGVSVEKIVGVAKPKEVAEINQLIGHKVFFEWLEKSANGWQIVVKSKPCGLVFEQYKRRSVSHVNTKTNTLSSLVKSGLIKKLDEFQKLSISKQIITIISDLWQANIIHTHPHEGNWAIELINGIPKVTLIDLDNVIRTKHVDYLESDYSFVMRSIKKIWGYNPELNTKPSERLANLLII